MTQPGDICLVGADGNGELNISMDSGFYAAPDWAPDGSKVVFERGGEGWSRIYLMNPDGTNVSNLTTEPYFDSAPTWPPDGSMIVFLVGDPPSGNAVIWLMRADGTGRRPLSDGSEADRHPVWQPLPKLGSAPSSLPPSDAVGVPNPLPGTRRIPVPRSKAPTKPVDEIPVVGGSPGANDVDFPYGRYGLIAAGLIFIAGAVLALRIGRRL